jgi:SNF2 family DNA or RNA helicase
LSAYQRDLYRQAIQGYRAKQAESAINNHLGLIQYLRQLCTSPYPLGYKTHLDEPLVQRETKSPKLKWLLSMLADIQQKNEKVIVFVEFLDLQRQLQRCIAERYRLLPDIINGSTSAAASASNSRQKRIRAFQEKPGFGVIILSPLAVGFGVNIQAANHVVHFTRTWNPAKEDQATDRAYRIGQTKDVYVYYLVVTADFVTFDMKLDKLLNWKRSLSDDMLNGCGDLSGSDFDDLGASEDGIAFDGLLSYRKGYSDDR